MQGTSKTMPEGDLPVRVYEEAWSKSILSQKKAVHDVLEEFIRVYSDEQKYMDAIEAYIRSAQGLLTSIDSTESQTQSPDISTSKSKITPAVKLTAGALFSF